MVKCLCIMQLSVPVQHENYECESLLSELHLNRNIDDVTCRRVRHVITENERTLKAAKALENNSLLEFGSLMYQSHDSLRYKY